MTRLRLTIVGITVLTALASSSVALAGHGWADHHTGQGCAQSFDEAQRRDMESFRDFDAEIWRDGHDPDAVSIFPSGATFVGIDAIMDALAGHFADRQAVWSWTELSRRIDGCRTAVIRYDATYEIPAVGYHQRAVTVVTYVREHGRWLSIYDQGTMLEFDPGTTAS
jgi:hypothetical protein